MPRATDEELDVFRVCQLDQLAGFGHGEGHRFFDQHMQASLKGGLGLGVMHIGSG